VRAEAALKRAEVEQEFAADELKRVESLRGKNLTSQQQLDNARRAASVADANLSESQAAVDQARRDLQRTELKAPFDGLVREEHVDLGQFVTSGQNIAGKLKKISGAMGQATFNLKAGEVPTVNFELTGRYEPEADATQLTLALAGQSAGIKMGSAVATLAGSAISFATATLAINNPVSLLLDVNGAGGIAYAWIEQREISLTIDPLEVLVGTRNDDGIQRAKTLQAFSLAWGDMSIGMSKCQLRQIGDGERNGLSARSLQYVGTMNTAAGDETVIDVDTSA
jgi:multidrug efflux pump subunit AcrA (membrane-fusion protein)